MEVSMDRVTFDCFTRRTADLLDRRSLFAGLRASVAALAAGGLPIGTGAKGKHNHRHKHGNNGKSDACKKRVKRCRNEFLPDCETTEDPAGCEDFVNNCCKKACDSFDKATDCLFD
jgi:hypothetical protein